MKSALRSAEISEWVEASAFVLRNWLHELRLVLDAALPFPVVDTKDDCILFFHPKVMALFRHAPAGLERVQDIAWDPQRMQVAADALRTAVADYQLGHDVTLVLSDTEVLRPRLHMPEMKPALLKNALKYEIARISPIPETDLYYDARIAASASRSGRMEVSLRLTDKIKLRNCISVCHDAGLGIAEIRFEDDPRPAGMNAFPIDVKAYVRTLWRRYRLPALTAGVLFLAIAALFAFASYTDARWNVVETELGGARAEAIQVERLRRQILQTKVSLYYPANRKKRSLLVATLSRLTDVIPDDAWISEFREDGSKVHIQGTASNASDLIDKIDRSEYFGNAKFDAPVLRDGRNNSERFNISFDVRQAQR